MLRGPGNAGTNTVKSHKHKEPMTHHYLISSRKVTNGKFIAEPGPVRFLKTKVGALPDPSDEMKSAAWVEEVRDLADGIADSRIGQAGDVLIYIH